MPSSGNAVKFNTTQSAAIVYNWLKTLPTKAECKFCIFLPLSPHPLSLSRGRVFRISKKVNTQRVMAKLCFFDFLFPGLRFLFPSPQNPKLYKFFQTVM